MGRVDLQTYSHEDPKGLNEFHIRQHQRPSQYLSKICSCWRASYGSSNPVLVGGVSYQTWLVSAGPGPCFCGDVKLNPNFADLTLDRDASRLQQAALDAI